MASKEYTTVLIKKETLALLRKLAEADKRHNAAELHVLLDAELERRERMGIVRITELPHPEGAQVVPVIEVKGR